VQFKTPLSDWCALASGPGEICAPAGAVHKTRTKGKTQMKMRGANRLAQFDSSKGEKRIVAAALIASSGTKLMVNNSGIVACGSYLSSGIAGQGFLCPNR
jgi:hypothetical protein